MKKSLLALTILGAFASVASAQTSVTIYGSFDVGLRNQSNVNAAGASRLSMSSAGTYNSNRFGFRGTEDLGSGMNAHFVLESAFNSGTGALVGNLWSRQAYVGLGGAWGSLDFGRQYTIAFKVMGAYDPFVYKYTTIAHAVAMSAGVRNNNDIQYTGTFGPLTARAGYALGEVPGDSSTGSVKALGLNYNNGPLSLGGAYTDREILSRDNKHYTIGAAYKLANSAKFSVGYVNENQATAGPDVETETWWGGVAYDFTPALQGIYAYYDTEITGIPTQTARRTTHLIGATYALSKRTNFYTAMDFVNLDGIARIGTAPGPVQDQFTGVSVGINHTF